MPEYFDNNYIVSESMVLNSIQLIKTDVFHRSNNTGNDKRRVVLSLRGKPDVTWADILEKVLLIGPNNLCVSVTYGVDWLQIV